LMNSGAAVESKEIRAEPGFPCNRPGISDARQFLFRRLYEQVREALKNHRQRSRRTVLGIVGTRGDYRSTGLVSDASLEIFIHWGLSVPAFGSECTRVRCTSDNQEERIMSHYGPHSDLRFYKDSSRCQAGIIQSRPGAQLFKRRGPVVVPVAEHHDGFAM